jgi:hypothetical protein
VVVGSPAVVGGDVVAGVVAGDLVAVVGGEVVFVPAAVVAVLAPVVGGAVVFARAAVVAVLAPVVGNAVAFVPAPVTAVPVVGVAAVAVGGAVVGASSLCIFPPPDPHAVAPTPQTTTQASGAMRRRTLLLGLAPIRVMCIVSLMTVSRSTW